MNLFQIKHHIFSVTEFPLFFHVIRG